MNLPEVQKIAEGMKKTAKDQPIQFMQMMNVICGNRNIMEEYSKLVEFEGYDLKIILTFDMLSERMQGWHVSIGSMGSGLNIPDRICQTLLPYFLPMKRESLELPSAHGKSVRQFIEVCGKEN